jgi:hypothetical protein
MKDQRPIAAVVGFAFVAAWVAFGFGDAVLCLLGAVVFWTLAGVLQGNLDLGELQARVTNRGEDGLGAEPAPRPVRKTRVR